MEEDWVEGTLVVVALEAAVASEEAMEEAVDSVAAVEKAVVVKIV